MAAGFSNQPRVAIFQGIIPVPIGTWINNYVPVIGGGWSFGDSAWPIDFAFKKDAVTAQIIALKGTVFGPTVKQTTFEIGDFSKGNLATSLNCIYNGSQILSMFPNSAPAHYPSTFAYGLQLGTNIVHGIFNGLDYPAYNAAAFPGPGFNNGSQLGANKVIYGTNDIVTLVTDKLLSWSFGGNVAQTWDFPLRGIFPTNLGKLGVDPATNSTWATVGGSGAIANLCRPDFGGLGFLEFFTLTWDNPVINGYVSFDFNISNTSATPYGWLTTELNNGSSNRSVTINGTLYTSYMILTSLDGTKWWLLNIIPTDADSAGWQGSIGTVTAKFFPNGQLVLHHNSGSKDALIFASVQESALFKMLPVFPPVSLPSPPPDNEGSILPFREVNAKT